MEIAIYVVGKTNKDYLEKGVREYLDRLKYYVKTSFEIIPEQRNKNLKPEQQKKQESDLMAKKLKHGDYVICLDEKGSQFSSIGFSQFLQKKFNGGYKRIVFIIGGAYGISESLYSKVNEKVGLSKMTFAHDMVRLIFIEQLYRAMTILKGEPYHH